MNRRTAPTKSEYPTLDDIPLGVQVRIWHDGREQAIVPDANAAFTYILRHVPYSVSHALKHEGWRCEVLPS